MRINPQEFVSFPKEVVIGFIPQDKPLAPVHEALVASGIPDDRIDFLQGAEGVKILAEGGDEATLRQRLLRKVEKISEEGENLLKAVKNVSEGQTMVGVRDVTREDSPEVRATLEQAGVVDHHYYGRHTFD